MDNEDIAATTMILPRRLEGSTALLTRCLAFVLLVVGAWDGNDMMSSDGNVRAAFVVQCHATHRAGSRLFVDAASVGSGSTLREVGCVRTSFQYMIVFLGGGFLPPAEGFIEI